MILRALCLLVLLAPVLAAGTADEDYTVLRRAADTEEHLRVLELAESFVAEHPAAARGPDAALLGADASITTRRPARGAALLSRAAAANPGHARVRDRRIELLHAAGQSDECLLAIESALKAQPDTPLADYWSALAAECLFHTGQFARARALCNELLEKGWQGPEAKALLARINPAIEVAQHGIATGYAGKYAKDARFKRALARLPEYAAAAMPALEKTLGVKVPLPPVVFEFQDKGDARDTVHAYAEGICLDYKPFTRVVFYTEHVVLSEPEFARRVIHELKHAAFRHAMGARYGALPLWIREGLAVYGAGQLEARLAAVATDRAFGGNDPKGVLRGVELDDTTEDYAESALAFEWLEGLKPGNIKAFCEGLLRGEHWDALLAKVSDLEATQALAAAHKHATARLQVLLGEPGKQYMAIQDDELAAVRQGNGLEWLKQGVPRYQQWLAENPAHLLSPNALYRAGKGLILTGQHEQGRALLARILAHGGTSFCDDAQYWIAASHEQAGDENAAAREFGVLLRDYSWSAYANALRGRYQPAGPVTDNDAD